MNNYSKGVSIILYLLWPFSAVIIGIKNFDSSFGRKLLIAAFAFLGYTAIDFGDLAKYALYYYEATDKKLDTLFDLFLNLQIGKFFNDFTAILFSIFDNHHIYFAFLFSFYGYLLVNTINLLRIKILKKSNFSVLVSFIAFALFYSVLTIFNYAFYTGALFFLYYLMKIILNKNNGRQSLLIFLTPLFHIGLVPLLLIPLFYRLFNQNTKWYILLLVVFTTLPQSLLVNSLEKRLVGTDTVFENRYNSYASEKGKELMDQRYDEGYQSGNFNYKLFTDSRKITNKVAIPLLLFILFYNRKTIIKDKPLLDLFNISIACLAITNLMLNISQGERFYFISGFMVLGTYAYYLQKYNFRNLKCRFFLFLIIPTVLLTDFFSLIVAKNFIDIEFFISNFILKFIGL